MTLHMAHLVADEVSKAHPNLDTRIVDMGNGKYVVKVRDGCELVMKFEGSKC